MQNRLFYGDNLTVLRESVPDASVDLVYLDPPFNSAATYNVLYKSPDGVDSASQIEAFEDTWRWGPSAESAFFDVLKSGHTGAAVLLRAMRSALGENDMMAYLAMMAARLIELHRVLKPTGSLYLHCDPTASHYLKVLMDAVFRGENCRNEIIWRRTTPKGLAFTRFATNHDTILAYARDGARTVWNPIYRPHDPDKALEKYSQRDSDGRAYQLTSLLNPNHDRPNLRYEFKGVLRTWRWTRERMLEADRSGLIVVPRDGQGVPRFKRYLDEQEGIPIGSVWEDIPAINSQAQERLGYPTQKPLALLERIIQASSNPGDTVLDPFCGCGTAVHAAQRLGRAWIGIDVTHLAISLIERRLKDAFGENLAFTVEGTPRDLAGARDLAARNKYQFQWWAVSLVSAMPWQGKKKGADGGIDGIRWMRTGPNPGDIASCVVSVKGGDNVNVGMIRDLRTAMENANAEAALFLTLSEPTAPMRAEAAKAGLFASPFAQKPYQRVQIWTIRELLAGMRPDLPPLGRDEGFRRAPKEKIPDAQPGLGL